MQQDYYHALARIVIAIAPDDARMRRKVYDFARHKLRQQLDRQSSVLNGTERAKQLLELEAAIEQIEVEFADDKSRLTYPALKVSSAPSSIRRSRSYRFSREAASVVRTAWRIRGGEECSRNCAFTPGCDNVRSCCSVRLLWRARDNSARTPLDVAVRRADRSRCTE